jgi:hypothetical protein
MQKVLRATSRKPSTPVRIAKTCGTVAHASTRVRERSVGCADTHLAGHSPEPGFAVAHLFVKDVVHASSERMERWSAADSVAHACQQGAGCLSQRLAYCRHERQRAAEVQQRLDACNRAAVRRVSSSIHATKGACLSQQPHRHTLSATPSLWSASAAQRTVGHRAIQAVRLNHAARRGGRPRLAARVQAQPRAAAAAARGTARSSQPSTLAPERWFAGSRAASWRAGLAATDTASRCAAARPARPSAHSAWECPGAAAAALLSAAGLRKRVALMRMWQDASPQEV